MKSVPQTPFFVPRLKIDSGGVDFLGMRQATLDLREKCLPGYSNSTTHLRPFSLMSWVYWKLNRLATAMRMETITNTQAVRFREKIEILFTWGHKLQGIDGLPGITFGPPSTGEGAVPLTFQDWKR